LGGDWNHLMPELISEPDKLEVKAKKKSNKRRYIFLTLWYTSYVDLYQFIV
jgi:hypothetical protein